MTMGSRAGELTSAHDDRSTTLAEGLKTREG